MAGISSDPVGHKARRREKVEHLSRVQLSAASSMAKADFKATGKDLIHHQRPAKAILLRITHQSQQRIRTGAFMSISTKRPGVSYGLKCRSQADKV